MIQCPKCAQGLPDWAQVCQFCGADTKSVARPAAPRATYQAPAGQPKWVWPAYYAVCGYYVLSGLFRVVQALVTATAKTNTEAGATVAQLSIFGAIIGAITVLIGVGLIAKVQFVRAIVNFFCYLKILGGLCGIGGSILAGAFVGPIALIGVAFNVFDIATAALMIFLIGETD